VASGRGLRGGGDESLEEWVTVNEPLERASERERESFMRNFP